MRKVQIIAGFIAITLDGCGRSPTAKQDAGNKATANTTSNKSPLRGYPNAIMNEVSSTKKPPFNGTLMNRHLLSLLSTRPDARSLNNMHSLFRHSCHPSISRLPAVILVALAWTIFAFTGHSQETKTNQTQTANVINSSPTTHEGETVSVQLIKEANELQKQHLTSDAIARVKAAIAADPMSHRPWRALEQMADKLDSKEETLKCWDDIAALYPSNAFCLAFHAKIFAVNDKIGPEKLESELQKAKAVAPADPFILFYCIESFTQIGQYDTALQDVKTFKDSGGNEQANAAVSLYELILLGLNRQFHGSNLPDGKWETPEKYEIDLSILNRGQPWLIQLCGANLQTKDFILGGNAVSDFQPKRWKFGGSEENPFPYAPGLFIWDGSVISVPRYGTLVVNGTHLKYVQTLNGATISRIGTVKNWLFVFAKENK